MLFSPRIVRCECDGGNKIISEKYNLKLLHFEHINVYRLSYLCRLDNVALRNF